MVKTALGLMSGTSMDGMDLALIRSDGDRVVEFGPTLSVAYPASFKRRIEQGLADAQELLIAKERLRRPGSLAALEQEITTWHADAVATFLTRESMTTAQIDLLGFHGQTIIHRPQNALTVQLGDGPRLARLTGIATVYDMRARDMELGGQGAPLVPVFHQALARTVALEGKEPIVFVNIGGISNVTYIDGDADPIAFDSGPGNALIDQWVQAQGGVPYDQGGRIASEGGVSAFVVDRYLANPFFKRSGPKSLDRSDFAPLTPGDLELSDGARTLAHISAAAIAKSAQHFPRIPKRWILCGGGRLNTTLVSDLRVLIQPTGGEVLLAEDVGLEGDMLEAQAFGYLAIRSAKGLPLTFPTTTGCQHPTTGGVLRGVTH
ncbi:MAG: anhydro-N-acetylmuramic acid kinase [Pseudomonadota bacterium]